jgi:epoxide hydrolase 4
MNSPGDHGQPARRAPGAGIELHYVEAGTGPAVVLLHGFPDFRFGWRHQVGPLAAAGLRVLAPDLRGYGGSDRPQGAAAYSVDRLADDVVGFIRHCSPGGAALVGHDCGGVIAWRVAAQHPGLCRRLCVLNAPHGDLYRRALVRNPRQLLRSWYVLVNQLPAVPELLLRASGYRVLKRVLGRDERGRRMASREEVQRYIDMFSQRGALTAALNYYRAAGRAALFGRTPPTGPISVPTLVIWGELDRYLDERLLDGLPELVADLRIERLPDAGHFVHWQEPAKVNALLLDFLREPAAG